MNFEKLNLNKYSNVYVYGFGLSGKWFSDNSPKKINFFIDTDEKKSGRKHNNIEVLNVQNAKKITKIKISGIANFGLFLELFIFHHD